GLLGGGHRPGGPAPRPGGGGRDGGRRGAGGSGRERRGNPMRIVAVTACPTGVAHTVMAAEALRRQAEVLGHEIEVETQGGDGIRHPLSPEAIAAADAVV